MEEVAHDNADVVFTTSIRMRPACLKVAAQHPKPRFLNCCLNAPHPLVRTYYPRTYEANYLLGMLAGILNLTDRVGYVAANPVYGVPAAVNAFARGLRTVRPNSHILLRWACLQEPGKPLDFSDCPASSAPSSRAPGTAVPAARPSTTGGASTVTRSGWITTRPCPRARSSCSTYWKRTLRPTSSPSSLRASLRRGISPRHPLQIPTPPRN